MDWDNIRTTITESFRNDFERFGAYEEYRVELDEWQHYEETHRDIDQLIKNCKLHFYSAFPFVINSSFVSLLDISLILNKESFFVNIFNINKLIICLKKYYCYHKKCFVPLPDDKFATQISIVETVLKEYDHYAESIIGIYGKDKRVEQTMNILKSNIEEHIYGVHEIDINDDPFYEFPGERLIDELKADNPKLKKIEQIENLLSDNISTLFVTNGHLLLQLYRMLSLFRLTIEDGEYFDGTNDFTPSHINTNFFAPLYTNEMEMFTKSPKYSNAILLVEHKLKLKSGLRTVIKDDIDLVWKDINEEFLATRLGKVWAECRGSKGRFSLKLYMDGIEEPELTEFLSYRSMLEYLELKFKNPGYKIPFIKYEEEDEINYNTILFAYVPLNKDIYEEGYSSDWVKTFLSSLLFSKFQKEIKSMLFDADANVIPKNFMTIIGVLAFQGVFTGNASSLATYFQFDKVKKQSIARYISTGMKNGVSIPIQKWILDYIKDNGLKKD